MPLTDIQKEKSLLSKLKDRISTATVGGRIIKVPRDKVRFVCPNHKMKVVIDMSENSQRKEENKMEEFQCDCGTIYIKGDEYS